MDEAVSSMQQCGTNVFIMFMSKLDNVFNVFSRRAGGLLNLATSRIQRLSLSLLTIMSMRPMVLFCWHHRSIVRLRNAMLWCLERGLE